MVNAGFGNAQQSMQGKRCGDPTLFFVDERPDIRSD
jgi:hypothetical protein